MKILLAPDSFKGSLSALQVCAALQAGALRVCPDAEFELCPLADGGEGTLDALVQSAGGFFKVERVQNPRGESVEARWGILPDGKAVIEMAQAAGLSLIAPQNRDTATASTYGVGQLIKAALRAGCREILVALGGSATTDGGAGALAALGAYLRDERDVILPPGGAALSRLASIDLKWLDPKLARANFSLLCDVTNPLCGENGAAQIYAPQKGADAADALRLDAALLHFSRLAREKTGADCALLPGAGAAGGLAFGLMAFCGAQVQSGIEAVMEAADFAAKLRGADLVLTGEGALDAQTLRGKVVAGVGRAAKLQGVPVLAFGGRVQLSGAELDELGVLSAFSLADGPRDLAFCIENAAPLLTDATERALRLWKPRA